MANPNIHRIVKVEEHWLPSCQCHNCQVERERRRKLNNSHLYSLSVEAAHILGFISQRCPEGSLARRVQMERGSGS